jgi:hypothetical protein
MENRIGFSQVSQDALKKTIENSVITVAGGYITFGGSNTALGNASLAMSMPPEKPSFMKVKDWLSYKRLQLEMDKYVRASYVQENISKGSTTGEWAVVSGGHCSSHSYISPGIPKDRVIAFGVSGSHITRTKKN